MQIPTRDKKFVQTNRGDSFGNLFATFNMDFDTIQGKVRVSPRLRIGTDEVDDVSLTLPIAFVRSSADNTDRWWALCGTTLFKTSGTDPTAAYTKDDIANSPTNAVVAVSDMVEFNDKLYVSLQTDIAELESGTWDTDWWTTSPRSGTAPTTALPHPLQVTLKTNTFLVGDGNLVHAMDKNENVSNSRIILPAEYQVIWFESNKEGTWIGARHTANGEAKVFFWDESAENYNRAYGVKHESCFAGIIKDGICWTINGAGKLLQFDGSGFTERAVFPIFQQINKKWSDETTILRMVHRNGMAVIDEKIHILVNSNVLGVTALENFPSGVWTFDEDEGLRHKYSAGRYDGTEDDYGQFLLIQVGALVPTQARQGLLLAGVTFPRTATASRDAIVFRDLDDSVVKRGHFVTSVFESAGFEDVFQDLLLSFKRLRSSSDRIIISYRTIKDPNFPIRDSNAGTWTDANTFTTTADLANVVAGNEIFIIRGEGSGTLLTVDSISFATPTYTVNLTETTPNVSGTFKFIVDNYTLAATVSTQGIDRQEFDLDAFGTFIQLKVELRSASGNAGAGDSPELEKLEVTQKPDAVI